MKRTHFNQRQFTEPAYIARALAILGLSLLISTLPCPVLAGQSKIKVAIFVGRGAQASEFRKEFDRSDDDYIDYETVIGEDIRDGYLNKFDAILVPGGSAKREALSMGLKARDEVRRFVKEGGIYMGVCAGAYLASEQGDLDLALIPLSTADSDHWYRVDDMTPVDVELTPAGMDIFGIPKPYVKIGYENGPIFKLPAPRPDMNFCPVGFFRSEVVGDGGERGVMRG
ncbi:MAG: DJ-1/PfpI family protein, partial [Candidatus Obscuribacterales bacterium]|nr:DJ-1/PfpI family protein [Candidatus Obscuribacterales bacterium]